MDPVDNNVTTPTDIEQTDAQQVIEHVDNLEAVAPYENPDLRDLMAAHALLSLAGALTAAPSVQHNSTGSNAVLEVTASTASGSTAAPVMPIQATSTIINTPATVPVVTAPPYCAPAHCAGPSVQYRVTNSGAASTSRHSADDHAGYTSAYINPTPANFNTGPSIESRCANADAAPANPIAGPSVKRRASSPQQPKRQRANSYGGGAVVKSSDSGEGASNAGQDVPTTIIRDVAGEVVTAAQFSSLFKRFIFLGFDMILVVYSQLVGHELVAASVSFRQLSEQLGKIEGFEVWEQGFHVLKESFLVRCGSVYQQMCQRLQRRLRIAGVAQAGVVPAPVLYFHVVTIGCVHAKQLVDAAPLEMFKTVAGCDLGSRWIISENGPISFTGSRYCELAREWLLNICNYITKDGCMEPLLTTADDCYKAYEKTGRDRGNKGAIFDPDGSIGQEILQSNDLALKLVIGLSYVDMLELYEVLPCMVDGMFDKDKSDYLKRVSSFASSQLKLLPEH
ncbi:hypothetical protein GGH13_000280 [Coemansia sp. S155-1]|nr:hypothetical protein GGH13_000280 [Coemansia sp. S155-1]